MHPTIAHINFVAWRKTANNRSPYPVAQVCRIAITDVRSLAPVALFSFVRSSCVSLSGAISTPPMRRSLWAITSTTNRLALGTLISFRTGRRLAESDLPHQKVSYGHTTLDPERYRPPLRWCPTDTETRAVFSKHPVPSGNPHNYKAAFTEA